MNRAGLLLILPPVCAGNGFEAMAGGAAWEVTPQSWGWDMGHGKVPIPLSYLRPQPLPACKVPSSPALQGDGEGISPLLETSVLFASEIRVVPDVNMH